MMALSAGFLVVGAGAAEAHAQAQQGNHHATAAKLGKAARSKAQPETEATSRNRRNLYFKRNWGVDVVGVRRVSSGFMLRFDYRVVDSERASAITDHKVRPYLIDEATGTALAVPAMENIGELRQVAPPEVGRTYFVIFGNPGGLVKPGGRVTLVIGNFRAEGLVVD
jgi:hypothetical protein